MRAVRYILSQLVESDELSALSPEELRAMLAELDDEVVYGEGEDGENAIVPSAPETPAEA